VSFKEKCGKEREKVRERKILEDVERGTIKMERGYC